MAQAGFSPFRLDDRPDPQRGADVLHRPGGVVRPGCARPDGRYRPASALPGRARPEGACARRRPLARTGRRARARTGVRPAAGGIATPLEPGPAGPADARRADAARCPGGGDAPSPCAQRGADDRRRATQQPGGRSPGADGRREGLVAPVHRAGSRRDLPRAGDLHGCELAAAPGVLHPFEAGQPDSASAPVRPSGGVRPPVQRHRLQRGRPRRAQPRRRSR